MAEQQQIQVKITDEILKGVYANLVVVGHSKEEFAMDFVSVSPAQGQGIVGAKVFLSPGHAKRLLAALSENIGKYEKQFGMIQEAKDASVNSEIGFQAAA